MINRNRLMKKPESFISPRFVQLWIQLGDGKQESTGKKRATIIGWLPCLRTPHIAYAMLSWIKIALYLPLSSDVEVIRGNRIVPFSAVSGAVALPGKMSSTSSTRNYVGQQLKQLHIKYTS